MMMFIRAVAADDKAEAIKNAVSGDLSETFFPKLTQFAELPGSPFAYWVGKGVRDAFQRFPTVEGKDRAVRQGLATANDFRFLRTHWKVEPRKRGTMWYSFAKGGELSPFYASLDLVVNWYHSGKEMKAWADPLYGNSGWSRIIKSTEFYFRPGMTWPLRASRFAPQPLPEGCIFSVRGYSVFVPEDDLLPSLAIFNSTPFDYLFKALLGRFGYPEFIVGVLQKLPWPRPDRGRADSLAALARSAWEMKRAEDTAVETSHAFLAPAWLNSAARINRTESLANVQRKIDELVFEVFGFGSEERKKIEGATVFCGSRDFG
jgi:hypothetical protein